MKNKFFRVFFFVSLSLLVISYFSLPFLNNLFMPTKILKIENKTNSDLLKEAIPELLTFEFKVNKNIDKLGKNELEIKNSFGEKTEIETLEIKNKTKYSTTFKVVIKNTSISSVSFRITSIYFLGNKTEISKNNEINYEFKESVNFEGVVFLKELYTFTDVIDVSFTFKSKHEITFNEISISLNERVLTYSNSEEGFKTQVGNDGTINLIVNLDVKNIENVELKILSFSFSYQKEHITYDYANRDTFVYEKERIKPFELVFEEQDIFYKEETNKKMLLNFDDIDPNITIESFKYIIIEKSEEGNTREGFWENTDEKIISKISLELDFPLDENSYSLKITQINFFNNFTKENFEFKPETLKSFEIKKIESDFIKEIKSSEFDFNQNQTLYSFKTELLKEYKILNVWETESNLKNNVTYKIDSDTYFLKAFGIENDIRRLTQENIISVSSFEILNIRTGEKFVFNSSQAYTFEVPKEIKTEFLLDDFSRVNLFEKEIKSDTNQNEKLLFFKKNVNYLVPFKNDSTLPDDININVEEIVISFYDFNDVFFKKVVIRKNEEGEFRIIGNAIPNFSKIVLSEVTFTHNKLFHSKELNETHFTASEFKKYQRVIEPDIKTNFFDYDSLVNYSNPKTETVYNVFDKKNDELYEFINEETPLFPGEKVLSTSFVFPIENEFLKLYIEVGDNTSLIDEETEIYNLTNRNLEDSLHFQYKIKLLFGNNEFLIEENQKNIEVDIKNDELLIVNYDFIENIEFKNEIIFPYENTYNVFSILNIDKLLFDQYKIKTDKIILAFENDEISEKEISFELNEETQNYEAKIDTNLMFLETIFSVDSIFTRISIRYKNDNIIYYKPFEISDNIKLQNIPIVFKKTLAEVVINFEKGTNYGENYIVKIENEFLNNDVLLFEDVENYFVTITFEDESFKKGYFELMENDIILFIFEDIDENTKDKFEAKAFKEINFEKMEEIYEN